MSDSTPSGKPTEKKSKRHPLRRWLNRLLIIIAVIAVILVAVIGVTVSYLSPSRLTPLVTRMASDYLDAEVKASRVELFFYKSFPKVSVEVDSLSIVSRSLGSLPDSLANRLPEDYPFLLSVKSLSGGINLAALSTGKIELLDVEIVAPRVNLVKADSLRANYLIFPESENKEKSEIPDLSINRFAITGDAKIDYFSLPDTVNAAVNITTSLSQDADERSYILSLEGDADGLLSPTFRLPLTGFGLDGRIGWSPDEAYSLSLSDMKLRVADLDLNFSTSLDFADRFTVKTLEAVGRKWPVTAVIPYLPENIADELRKVDTDLTLSFSAELAESYQPGDSLLPSAALILSTEGYLNYQNVRLNKLESDISVDFNGTSPDLSTVTVNRLHIVGPATALDISAKVTSPVSDPYIEGKIKGSTQLRKLPRLLIDRIKFHPSGLFTADADYKLRVSDLTGDRFHKIKVNGSASLINFEGHTTTRSIEVHARKAKMKFGSNASFSIGDSAQIDSMLAAHVDIDTATAYVNGGELVFSGRNIRAGAMTKNISTSRDTTIINPLGGRVKADMLKLHVLNDSIWLTLFNSTTLASLQRYKNHARHPLISLSFNTSSLRFTNPLTRVGLNNPHIKFAFHPKAKPKMNHRLENIFDSLTIAYPKLRPDSIYIMARKEMRAQNKLRPHRKAMVTESNGTSDLNLKLNSRMSAWLRWLDARGSISAKAGRMMSAMFPLPARVRNLSLKFTTDSVNIDTLSLKLGQTDLKISGNITNIERALTSGRAPVKAEFVVFSDTININQLAKAAFTGSAYMARRDSLSRLKLPALSDNQSDSAAITTLSRHADKAGTLAFVVPSNLEAEIIVRANNALYSDIWVQQLQGNIGILDGAVNLDRLGAFTPIGSFDLTALYSAPDLRNIDFAVGLVVRKLQLGKFLDLMPQIDSLMPVLNSVEGIVTAELAATSSLDSILNFKASTLRAMLRLTGDSLVLLDNETFRTIGKWLMFKNKDQNMIDHMNVELQVADNMLHLFPFVFDFDRYRIGVAGSNDMAFNLNYHIAVLKSPIPFKFGVYIKGRPGHLRFSLGKAKFNEKQAVTQRNLTDTLRINLIDEIERVFKFGVTSGELNARLQNLTRPVATEFEIADTLSHADSLFFINNGILPPVDTIPQPMATKPKKRFKNPFRRLRK